MKNRPSRIEGYAIISANGMLADAEGVMPPSLKIEADQRFFHGSLNRADAVVHGRNSHEGGPNAPNRPRLIVTRRISAIARHPDNPKAVLWNPAGAPFEDAWKMLGVDGGLLALVGGTEIFGIFLDVGYDAFYLTRAAGAGLGAGGCPAQPRLSGRRHPPFRRGKQPTAHHLDTSLIICLMTGKRESNRNCKSV
jgi:hypothetical protein